MDRFEVMLEPLRVFLTQIADFLPRLALALIVLIAGWLIAKAVRFAISRGLRKVNFHIITERAGIDGFLKDGGIRMDATDILAMLVYWIVILVALVVGFNLLGLTYVTELLSRALLFVPKVLVALLILAFGAPAATRVELVVATKSKPLKSGGGGWFELVDRDSAAGTLSQYRIDGKQLVPDPASRFQPKDVDGPSEVIDPSRYPWKDAGW